MQYFRLQKRQKYELRGKDHVVVGFNQSCASVYEAHEMVPRDKFVNTNISKMASAKGRFDDFFFGILQNCGQVEPFLDVVFSFLARRTDFFHIMYSRDDKMGFPTGVAEKMVLQVKYVH